MIRSQEYQQSLIVQKDIFYTDFCNFEKFGLT